MHVVGGDIVQRQQRPEEPGHLGRAKLVHVIIGVGVDIVDIIRFAAALERTPRLALRLFTKSERAQATPSLAARFAAKEAVAKALGAPPGLRWTDVEVGSYAVGQPYVRARGTVEDAAMALGVDRWHVSLSHDGGMAIAMVIAES